MCEPFYGEATENCNWHLFCNVSEFSALICPTPCTQNLVSVCYSLLRLELIGRAISRCISDCLRERGLQLIFQMQGLHLFSLL